MITNRQSTILTPTGTFNPGVRTSTLSPFPPRSPLGSQYPSSPLSNHHPFPIPNAPPPYQASAPEPTPSSLERSLTSLTTKSQTDNKQLPFPRWLTLSTRGFLAAVEIAGLGYGIYFLSKYLSDPSFETVGGSKSRHELAISTMGVAAVVDISAVVLVLLRRYGKWGYWMFVMLVDFVVGVMGCVAAVGIYMVHLGHGDKGVEEHGLVWEDQGKVVGLFGLVCGLFHILACLGGCAGCCIVTYRQKIKSTGKFY